MQLTVISRFLQMMSALNPSCTTLFLVLVLSFKLSQSVEKTTVSCPEIEKQSLLNFKQSLKDPNNTLISWDSEVNCCEWKGVVCNNLTGHVHQLRVNQLQVEGVNQLQGEGFRVYLFEGLRGKINPSLLNLKHLRYLDLSLINFGETIPSFIGSFTNLEYLNLSWAGLHGKIPHSLGNLSHLHTLDLDNNQLDADRLDWLSGLPKVEYLNMNSANLSRATNWLQVINTLPSLLELHFQSCSLEYDVASLNHVNITSLRFLDLSCNYFESQVPSWIFQLSNLLFLDISDNFYVGPIPSISNTTKLHYIDLSRNRFNSSIPDWLFLCTDLEFVSLSGNLQGTISNAIGNLTSLNTLDLSGSQLSGKIPREISNLCKLKRLVLSRNKFQGGIDDSFGNMSACFLEALEELSLDRNHLSGKLTDDFGGFKSLRILSLYRNALSGAIPISVGNLSSLESLFIDNNKLDGNLPESLGQLSNLTELWIENNMLEGVVTEAHFANLTRLKRVYASRNGLSLKVGANWTPPFQLSDLSLESWNLGTSSQVLSWLGTQKDVLWLDLSNTGISGNIPPWFWETSFSYLNLSHNHLLGNIPYIRDTEYAYLSSNQFSGSLPSIEGYVTELDLSDNSFSGGMSPFFCNRTYYLEILHLGGNQLVGELPDCWMQFSRMRYLNFGNNKMHGSIPTSFGYLADLQSLSLYGNKFSGQIPFSMHNCSELSNINLIDNNLDGSIPTWMGTSLVRLRFLILRSNKMSGEISPTICHLNSLQILDLSNNRFSGMIPSCVNNFTAMATERSLGDGRASYAGWGVLLESASIPTKGSELRYDTLLTLVTAIDLSKNSLSGEIPKELTSLVELRTLNLSQNHFSGSIPDSIGDMKQLESLDFSGNSLSGQIPNSFKLLSSLNYLNLSFNNFTGKIPESTQLQGLDASSFIGNNLCGPPLGSDCGGRDGVKDEDGSEESAEIVWFYVFLSSGIGVGISIVFSVMVVKKSWREAYYGWLECMWDEVYVFVYLNWRRLCESINLKFLKGNHNLH